MDLPTVMTVLDEVRWEMAKHNERLGRLERSFDSMSNDRGISNAEGLSKDEKKRVIERL